MAVIRVPRRLARRTIALSMVGALLVAPASTAAAAPPPDPTGPRPSPVIDAVEPRPFRLQLADDGDHVRQTNNVQCVGASVQMMLNMVRPGADRTARTQRRLQVLARSLSGPRPDGTERQGAGVFGWADALGRSGGGAYAVVGARTLQGAMRLAARAIVEQRRPVGLLVWQGRHAWVMSGFEATGDPRDGAFRVTAASILDPLYPGGSDTWGPSPRPGSSISMAEVGRQFVKRRVHSEWNRLPGMADLAGQWVLVLPVDGPAPANPALAAAPGADPADPGADPADPGADPADPAAPGVAPGAVNGAGGLAEAVRLPIDAGWFRLVCATLRYSGRWARRSPTLHAGPA